MVIEHQADHPTGWIVHIQRLEEQNKFSAAMPRMDFGHDVTVMQIEASQNRERAVPVRRQNYVRPVTVDFVLVFL